MTDASAPSQHGDPTPARGSRLDAVLVRQGLARSRGQARDLIAAGAVHVDGQAATKSSWPVLPSQHVTVQDGPRWVSRAADKLVAALATFSEAGLVVTGKRCIDAGASTGGFTQVLLHHGAREVVALDVGHGQLHALIASDPRVVERAGVNIRGADAQSLGGRAQLVVADLSFISLRIVLPVLVELMESDGDLVLLVKPQFEVGRQRLGKGGLVRSAADQLEVVLEIAEHGRALGLEVIGVAPSPVRGTAGNAEYLLYCTRRPLEGLQGSRLAGAARVAVEGAVDGAFATASSKARTAVGIAVTSVAVSATAAPMPTAPATASARAAPETVTATPAPVPASDAEGPR